MPVQRSQIGQMKFLFLSTEMSQETNLHLVAEIVQDAATDCWLVTDSMQRKGTGVCVCVCEEDGDHWLF